MITIHYTSGQIAFMAVATLFICWWLYAVITYPIEQKEFCPVPEGNIEFQYEYLMKLIEDKRMPLDARQMQLRIKQYENRFIDHVEIDDFVKRLRTALLIRSALTV